MFSVPVISSLLGGADADAMDTHTQATETSGTASASSEYSASYPAWRAADDAVGASNRWIAGNGSGVPVWWKYQFTTDQLSGGYSVTASGVGGWEGYMPEDWTFEGSNNDSDWDVLDTVTGETGWGTSEKRSFTFTNSTYYEYYRINISKIVSQTYATMGEIEILI